MNRFEVRSLREGLPMSHLHRCLWTVLAGAAISAATIAVHSQDSGQKAASKEWPGVSGDLGNTRYSTLTQINKETLAKLRGAWAAARFDDGGGGRAMPVVKDGLMFFTAAPSSTPRREDGHDRLEHQTGASPPSAGLTDFTRPEQGLPAREGVAVGDGLVFVGLCDAHVVALREKTASRCGTCTAASIRPPGTGRLGRAALRRRPRVRRHVSRPRVPRQGRRR